VSASHWNARYSSHSATAMSWYQEHPHTSLELLQLLGAGPEAAIIDVGGGASTLVDHLLAGGYSDVTVLDVSSEALTIARERLGDAAAALRCIEADLLTWAPTRVWDVWHDRAVLHFMVTAEARTAYVAQLRRALTPAGAFVIGTFAEDGPTECSALPVHRYAPDDLVELLGPVEVFVQRRELHHTPGGVEQPFNWVAGRLVS
jgi:trans-aconitate methyltransferase